MPCTAYNWVGGWVEINWSRGVATVGGCAHGRSLGRRLLSLAPCVLGSLGASECRVLLLNAALALLAISARSCKICSPALAPHLARRAQGNPHRSRARREDKPTGQWAGRARTPLWAPPGVVWRWIHSSAPAPRCCQCRRAAWRGTVCPAPLPLGTAARYWALAPTARTCERVAAAAASRGLPGRGAAASIPPCCLQHMP